MTLIPIQMLRGCGRTKHCLATEEKGNETTKTNDHDMFQQKNHLHLPARRLLAASFGAGSVAAQTQWPGNGHYYAVINQITNWQQAKVLAEGMEFMGVHGHLATITSEAENTFVTTELGGTAGAWLGGQQLPGSSEPAGGWQWITGEPWAYTKWDGGEPNNTYGGGWGTSDDTTEEVLQYHHNGTHWNDLPAYSGIVTPRFVVEWDVGSQMPDTTPPTFGDCPAGGPFLLNKGLQPVGPIVAEDQESAINTDASTLSGSVDTSSVGTKPVIFVAVNNKDLQATKNCSYNVYYNFGGFSQPIDNNLPNSAKAGQTIPIKWRLTDGNGTPIDEPNSFVGVTSYATPGSCGGTGDAIETYTGSSGLQYLGDGYWLFHWKTLKSYAGQCRTMSLNLNDGGAGRTASFTFK